MLGEDLWVGQGVRQAGTRVDDHILVKEHSSGNVGGVVFRSRVPLLRRKIPRGIHSRDTRIGEVFLQPVGVNREWAVRLASSAPSFDCILHSHHTVKTASRHPLQYGYSLFAKAQNGKDMPAGCVR